MHMETQKNSAGQDKGDYRNKRKRILELIEFIVVVVICIIMFFHEKGKQVVLDVGDRIEIGTYLGEPIQWRVIKKDGDRTVVLISEDILTNKAFDAPESGTFNVDDEKNDYWSVSETEADRNLELQEYVRGSNRWATSDIRTWLNSDEEVVAYEGIGPVRRAMAEMEGGYANEKGFLNGFSEREKKAIIPTQNVTEGNGLDKEPVESTDLVWLLSKDEMSWLEAADVDLFVRPTEQAVQQDKTNYYRIFSLEYGVEEYHWWLRDPVPGKSSKCYIVDNGHHSNLLLTVEAGVCGFGVRPVIKVDIRKL